MPPFISPLQPKGRKSSSKQIIFDSTGAHTPPSLPAKFTVPPCLVQQQLQNSRKLFTLPFTPCWSLLEVAVSLRRLSSALQSQTFWRQLKRRASSTAVCLRFGDEQNALLIDGDQKMLLCLSGASTLAVLPDGLKALRTAGP